MEELAEVMVSIGVVFGHHIETPHRIYQKQIFDSTFHAFPQELYFFLV